MHSDHDVFIQGVEQKRRIRINFSGRKNPQNLPRQCAPLHYSKGRIDGDDLDCYYLWDFEAAGGGHFLALPPSQIVTMELTEITFKIEDFSDFRRTTAGLTKSSAT
ncbi:MAG: hypothetical protein GY845_00940 [Planctomycetes bacterium]|nr:hypothetical protein [Planctomycetota bacterium]